MREAVRGVLAAFKLALEADPRLAMLQFVAVLLFLGGLIGTAVGLKLMIDAALQHDAVLGVVGGLVSAVSITSGVAWIPIGGPAEVAMRERVGGNIDRHLMRLTAAIPNLELQDRPEYLSKMRLLLDERNAMQFVITNVAFTGVFALVLIALAVVLALQHPLLVLVPLMGIPTLWIGALTERRFARAQNATAEERRLGGALMGLAVDGGAGKELRIFGLDEKLVARHTRNELEWKGKLDRESWKNTGLQSLSWFVFSTAFAGAVFLVVQRAVQGEATAGDVILTIVASAPLGFMAGFVGFFVGGFQQLISSSQRFLWLRDIAEKAARPTTDPATAPSSLRNGISLNGVGFNYPGSDQTVLSDVTLELPAGSVVALVGENGAGKTTLVKLLSRLYDPSEGQISVDGVDLRSIPAQEWRERIGAGFQDFMQFEVLARETVGLGDLPRITDTHAVEAAIDRAGASDVRSALPDGLETQLGKEWNGAELSTGQWQKLALSRAFMRDSPLLLILDEPTAALDATAEHALFERFSRAAREGRAARDRITVLVSHRFSTVRMADLIVVFEGGRVIEGGSHSELIRSGGLYAELYDIQARAYR